MADVELIRLQFLVILIIGSSIQSLIQILYRVFLEGRILSVTIIFGREVIFKTI